MTILSDDILYILRVLPEKMVFQKYLKLLGIFVILFMSITALICGLVLVNNLEKEFLKKYSLLTCGSSIAFACYAVAVLKRTEYMNLRQKIFSNFWPLQSMGEQNYQKLLNSAKKAKLFVIVTLLSSFATSTAGLPWFGNEYELMLPVKVYTDYLNTWAKPVLTLFYVFVYHTGFTMMATSFVLIHFALHLRMQFFLLIKRLQQLYIESSDSVEILDDSYQNYVAKELRECVQYHQYLLWVAQKLNNLIYFPIFIITTSSILFSVSLIFYLKDFQDSIIRGLTLAVTGSLVTCGFCVSGQLVQDESTKFYTSAKFLPWYLWNINNRKMYQILLVKSQTPVILSSSGIIVINYTLFISLYRTITTVLSFFMNV